ncbi:MAG: hypothetical protein B7Y25_03550 [Alphaproteobacteria bacterium 16-39-46]|nr:MAG: hypothetical protein B7Y25_03550 [Alphaproteobacteria bacterium 16-39-46]OZA43235.1 MAG: hypothetical protein B7X84_03775 [Alphaproteobacteria bacterium 17-39-52]HQS83991.1 nucleotidyltransferase domain-containing protein [Alphaproteobacteria bacterium]HQS93868.1 nucleotidyltransferase domain-containing protein [Alphaproteobacteria bacterium]
MNALRLDQKELDLICRIFRDFFLRDDKIWIFGSRVNPNAKGGDIDLYIETEYKSPKEIIEARLKFLAALKIQTGDQKIDVIVKYGNNLLPIYEVAQKEGVRLI